MKIFRHFLLLLLCFLSGTLFSQTLEGYVFDKASESPLQSATVYLDGTTISAITNSEGYFKIEARGNSKNVLVISYVGYITSRIENPFQYKKIKTFLETDAISMEEVVVGKSPFSRKSMLKVFREEFLGKSKAGALCKILNEDDVNLYFDLDTNTLSATSRNPLKIKNPYLGYEVNFELVDFNVEYNARSLEGFHMQRSYFSGMTFYKDISKPGKSDKKRYETYLGSTAHFMTALANQAWEKENFEFYVDKFRVDPTSYFETNDSLGLKKIKLIKEPLARVPKVKISGANFTDSSKQTQEYEDQKTHFAILYHRQKQSAVTFFEKEFVVDSNGNYSPIYGVMFSGYMGLQKVGDMLPTNYYESIQHKK